MEIMIDLVIGMIDIVIRMIDIVIKIVKVIQIGIQILQEGIRSIGTSHPWDGGVWNIHPRMRLRIVKCNQKGHHGIPYNVRQFFKTAYVIPCKQFTRPRLEGAPRDHIFCAPGLKDCLCDTLYTRPHGRRSVPQRF
jgi:hypothetical protein